MSRLDLGDHTPDAATGAQRGPNGAVRQPRALMHIEQERATLAWILGQVTRGGDHDVDEAVARVKWNDKTTTTLTVGVSWENTPDGRIATLAWRREHDRDGKELLPRGERWIARVRDELRGRTA